MDFLDLVKVRQSVRKYKDSKVEKEKIERCIEAARLAPSACNSQPWKFIIVDETEVKNAVARATCSRFMPINRFAVEAPVIVVVVMEKSNMSAQVGGMLKDMPYALIDIGIAAEHFCLQAAEEGLGTCIIGWFNEKEIKRILSIPGGKKVGLVITLGYGFSDTIRQKKRKETHEIVGYNKY